MFNWRMARAMLGSSNLGQRKSAQTRHQNALLEIEALLEEWQK